MVSLVSLWLPILLAAVLVFIASSVIHMVLPYHKNDFDRVPNEDQVASALRPLGIPPGEYMIPKPASGQEMKSAEFQEKLTRGPVVALTVFPAGQFAMGKRLIQWFVYCVIVGIFGGYVASRTLGAGAVGSEVLRVTGTVAFAGYGLALLQPAIWFGRSWSTTLKSLFDALIYAVLTAGAFVWLWPS